MLCFGLKCEARSPFTPTQLPHRALTESLRELRIQLGAKESELKRDRSEMEKLEAAFFRSNSEIRRLEEKEDARRMAEAELVHLRQEILLLGELQVKYKERLAQAPLLRAAKEEQLMTQAYEGQIAGEW